jgi:NAD-dependent deacetylase
MGIPGYVLDAARAARRVAVVSGAGMSAESGVPTFRDAQTGLWERYAAEDLATPEAWERDRAFVWAWYLWRLGLVRRAQPNAGHVAIAEWARLPGAPEIDVVTQNVDDLHERAGSRDVIHLHGSLAAFRCERCHAAYEGVVEPLEEEVDHVEPPRCRVCGAAVRPGVVWFGEMLPVDEWERAVEVAERCDLLLVVGTSGLVHPAAGLPFTALGSGATVIEVNPDETAISDFVHYSWRATAAEALPALVAALPGRTRGGN